MIVGKHFDFTESTAKIVDTIQREEEIYIGRKESATPDKADGKSFFCIDVQWNHSK